MAHKKGLGSSRNGRDSNAQRLGVKRFGGQFVKAGEPLTERNVRAIRPGLGLPPRHLDLILGRKVQRDVTRGTPLSFDLLMGEADS